MKKYIMDVIYTTTLTYEVVVEAESKLEAARMVESDVLTYTQNLAPREIDNFGTEIFNLMEFYE